MGSSRPWGSIARGWGATALPGVVGAVVAWWTPWGGLVLGVSIAVLFTWLWIRHLGRAAGVWAWVLAGFFMAGVSALLFTPALQLELGAIRVVKLDGQAPDKGEIVEVEATPRSDLAFAGGPIQERGTNRYFHRYPVVAPMVSAGWQPSDPVRAWALCIYQHDDDDRAPAAEASCRAKLANVQGAWKEPSLADPYFSTGKDLSWLLAEAAAARDLKQSDKTFVVQLVPTDDFLPDLFMPVVCLALVMFGVFEMSPPAGAGSPKPETDASS